MTAHLRPQTVFFDWDGTLVDTLPFLFTAHNHVRETLGYPLWSLPEFKHFTRYSSRELYGSLYGERTAEALDVLQVFYEANHLQKLGVLPDAKPLLERLQTLGIPTGIVSNKRHGFLLREIEHLGWAHLIRVSVGAGVAEKDKPAADPLLLALGQAGLAAGPDVWYVGDSETDMLTAQAAGCTAVLVRHHHDNEHLIAAHNPPHVFADCRSLQAFINR